MKEGLTLFELTVYVGMSLMALTTLAGIIRYNRLGKSQKLITALCLVALSVELISKYLWNRGINNYIIFHVYAVLEFTILALLYRNISNRTTVRRGFIISIALIWIFALVNAFFWQPIDTPNTNITTVSFITWIVVPIFFFFQITTDLRYPKLEQSALFWINIGVFVFHAGSFIPITFWGKLVEMEFLSASELFYLHNFFNIIQYTTYLIAVCLKPE